MKLFGRKKVSSSVGNNTPPSSSPISTSTLTRKHSLIMNFTGSNASANSNNNNNSGTTTINSVGLSGSSAHNNEDDLTVNDYSRFFSNNAGFDHYQNVESYGELIHLKELKEEKPSTIHIRNKESLFINHISFDRDGQQRKQQQQEDEEEEEGFPPLTLSQDEQEWLSLRKFAILKDFKNDSHQHHHHHHGSNTNSMSISAGTLNTTINHYMTHGHNSGSNMNGIGSRVNTGISSSTSGGVGIGVGSSSSSSSSAGIGISGGGGGSSSSSSSSSSSNSSIDSTGGNMSHRATDVQNIDKEGWMVKEGRLVKSWKKRWFVLSGNTLSYFTAPQGKRKGNILLDGANIYFATNRTDNHTGCLSLIAHELSGEEATDEDDSARTLYFDADSDNERHEWFLAICNKISVLKYQKDVKQKRLNPDLRVIHFFEQCNTVTNLNLEIRSDNPMSQNLRETMLDVVLAIKDSVKYHKFLSVINFRNCCMKDVAFIHLCSALTDNKSVIELNLVGNELKSSSMKALSQVLKKNCILKSINLDHNMVDDHGLSMVCDALKTNPNSKLEFLSFNHNKIGDAGAIALADLLSQKKGQFQWKTLNLNHNIIGDEGATKIAELLLQNDAYPSLQELRLGGNKIRNEGSISIANALNSNNKLKLLDLEYNKIEYDGIRALAFMLVENKEINTFILGGNKLGEQAVALLASTAMQFSELELSTKLTNTDQEDDN
jgi:Ran GTPase-activating protein (RanGAP) involved in mRNA processing and transport